MKCSVKIQAVKKDVTFRKFDDISINNLVEDFKNMNRCICDKFDMNPTADPNWNYNIIENTLSTLIEKHMPLHKFKFNKYKHKRSPWITFRFGILKSLKFRDKLYQSMKKHSINTTEYLRHKQNLLTCNRILKCSIREAKHIYYNCKFEKCKNDSKKTWKTINEIINRSVTRSLPEYIMSDNTKVTSARDMAEYFNIFLETLVRKCLPQYNKAAQ